MSGEQEAPACDAEHLDRVRARAARDRDFYDKGRTAFVSFVRGYKEHLCKFIFSAKRLELGRLGTGFGLLHLPAMPELKRGGTAPGFEPSSVVADSIPYSNREQERARKTRLAERAADRPGKKRAAPKVVRGMPALCATRRSHALPPRRRRGRSRPSSGAGARSAEPKRRGSAP